MARISSPRNALVRLVRALNTDRREREARGEAVIEGIRLTEEALAAGLTLSFFFYTAGLLEKERGRRLVERLAAAGVQGFEVTEEVLERVADTETPQGILAVCAIPRHRPEALPPGLVVVADGIQDPGNLGTLVRGTEALGGAGVAVGGQTVDPWSPKVIRASMGSLFRLPVVTAKATGPLLEALASRGFRVVTADPGGRRLPWEVDWSGPVALVIGSEAAGPSPAARALAAETVRIPMVGPTESLNAGVAGSLLLYEALRQRQAPGGRPVQ